MIKLFKLVDITKYCRCSDDEVDTEDEFEDDYDDDDDVDEDNKELVGEDEGAAMEKLSDPKFPGSRSFRRFRLPFRRFRRPRRFRFRFRRFRGRGRGRG